MRLICTVYRYTTYYNFKALILENGEPLYVLLYVTGNV